MNTQILAFTECPEFHALLEVECKEITGLRPIVHTEVEDLKGMLDLLQTVDILVINEPENKKTLFDLREIITNYASHIQHIFILGENCKDLKGVKSFQRTFITELFEAIKKSYGPKEKKGSGWTAIPLMAFTHFERLPFDLFVKITDDKYVKRIPAYEEINDALIQDFKKRGISDLYCEKEHNRNFSIMLINNMINKLDKDYDSIETKMTASNDVFITTREIIQSLGIASRVINVCEAAIERITQDVYSEKNQFGAYVRSLKEQSSLEFHYRLIELSSFIGAQLIEDMNFLNKKDEVKKLVFASYFCDMTLSNPTYIHYRRPEATEKLGLEEHNKINFHALRASELVSTYKDTPKEVSMMIRQHHGSFSGIGFPEQKSSELLPLSKILVISQDLAYDILTDERTNALEVLRDYVHNRRSGGFQELLELLERTMGQNLKETA
ncbi:HD domain-containing phosphohydrolase [Peredibacter sp. HCB2-198]|uniref:HD domain-containing phosphohydrolase n=1 Tax=Peredibacter sp. HCB2-198 TaxID=3383025 RepID=UPI0038B46408